MEEHLPPWLPVVIAAPFIGSFIGVLADRLPEHRPVVFARSSCDHCGAQLQAWELVPLVSYAMQRRRCRHCGERIRVFHPAIEIGAVIIAFWAALADADTLWVSCALGWSLLALSLIDIRCMRLPDLLTLTLVLAGLGVTWSSNPESLTDHAAAAAFGYLLLRSIAWIYRRLRGREGLGEGDAKLLAAAGAWLGLAAMPWVILLAATAGLFTALCLHLWGWRMRRDTAIPFGPFLALAMWLLWL
ncbi:MAG: prepilin peptidase, partial [Acetobacteraceae bacterium]|nr:prepilin peptidase [Acetobacteraceae bacterium]